MEFVTVPLSVGTVSHRPSPGGGHKDRHRDTDVKTDFSHHKTQQQSPLGIKDTEAQ